jgi:signal transduction histidine kinase
MDPSAFERLPDPVLLVLPTGETVYGNRAWNELAAGFGAPPRLSALFGPPAQVLLSEAKRSGRASAFLPLAVGTDANRGFRLTVRATEGEDALAVQLADLSEEVAWRHQLFLRNSELAVLNDIGTALAGTHSIDSLAQRIWEQTGRIMDNSNFFLALVDRATGAMSYPMWVRDGRVVLPDEPRPCGTGIAEHIVRGRQPVLLSGDVPALLEQMGIPRPDCACVSFLGVPILSDDEALGALALMDSREPERYGRHQLGILNIVATQAAAALRTASLFAEMHAAYAELQAAQTKLLESERLRGVTETVGALNHEVNNPLATIVGTAQLLLRGDGPDPATRTKVERILEGAKRIQFVTSRMATLIQATSRPYPGQTQILDLARSLSADEGSEAELLREVRERLQAPPEGEPKDDRAA